MFVALNIRNADDLKAGVNCVGARCENGRTILEVKSCTDGRIPFCGKFLILESQNSKMTILKL